MGKTAASKLKHDRTATVNSQWGRRIAIPTVLLALIQLTSMWLEAGFRSDNIAVPKRPLTALPRNLGTWTGEDKALDKELIIATGADEILDRVYSDNFGSRVFLHAARWNSITSFNSHHPPKVCYLSIGWQLKDERNIELQTGTGKPVTAKILDFSREGKQARVLYWYQLGSESYVDRPGAGRARRQQWGQAEWPSVEKFMFHASMANDESAASNLRDVAEKLINWRAVER